MLITKCFYLIFSKTKEKIEEGGKKKVILVIFLILILTLINNLLQQNKIDLILKRFKENILLIKNESRSKSAI